MPETTRSELHQALIEDDARIQRLVRALLEDVKRWDEPRARLSWDRFDRALRSHMLLEEERMLPLFEATASVEAAKLRAEHHQLRRWLDQLGIDLDLQSFSPDAADGLLQLLRTHEAHKERTLYAWAEAGMPKRCKTQIVERLHEQAEHPGAFTGLP